MRRCALCRTSLDGQRQDARYELRLGEPRFRVEVADGRIELGRGGADQPDATIETDPATLAAMLSGGRQLGEALRSGDVRIAGESGTHGAIAIATLHKEDAWRSPIYRRSTGGVRRGN
jgi:putative sterol carrier protein